MQNRPEGTNRQDTRQRGNAPQLHEKYKAMARDAQLAGDRVQTEYYLQFADHYFRVLNESRARFEEQRPQRQDNEDYEDDDGEAMAAEDGAEAMPNGRYEGDDAPFRQPPRYQGDRPQREARPEREDRPQREARPERDDRPLREARPEREDRPEREAHPQRTYAARTEEDEKPGIDLDRLPPAIARADSESDAGEGGEKDRPRPARRPRRPRDDTPVAA